MKLGLTISAIGHIVVLILGLISLSSVVPFDDEVIEVPLSVTAVNDTASVKKGDEMATQDEPPAVKETQKTHSESDAQYAGDGQVDTSAPLQPKEKPRDVVAPPPPSGDKDGEVTSDPSLKKDTFEPDETKADVPEPDIEPEKANNDEDKPQADAVEKVEEKVAQSDNVLADNLPEQQVVPEKAPDVPAPVVPQIVEPQPQEQAAKQPEPDLVPSPLATAPAETEKEIATPEQAHIMPQESQSQESTPVQPAQAKIDENFAPEAPPMVKKADVTALANMQIQKDQAPAETQVLEQKKAEDEKKVQDAETAPVVPSVTPQPAPADIVADEAAKVPPSVVKTPEILPIRAEKAALPGQAIVPKKADFPVLPVTTPLPVARPAEVKRLAKKKPKGEDSIEDILAMNQKALIDKTKTQGGGAARSLKPAGLGGKTQAGLDAEMANTLGGLASECIGEKLKLVGIGGGYSIRPIARLVFKLNLQGELIGLPQITLVQGDTDKTDIFMSQIQAAVTSCQPYSFLPRERFDLWKQGFDLDVDPFRNQ